MSMIDIKNKIRKIGEKYNLRRIYLFGSYARGTNTANSDIDFYAMNDEPISLIEHANILSDCKEAFKTDVDFIIYDGTEDEFMGNVHKDEELVYER